MIASQQQENNAGKGQMTQQQAQALTGLFQQAQTLNQNAAKDLKKSNGEDTPNVDVQEKRKFENETKAFVDKLTEVIDCLEGKVAAMEKVKAENVELKQKVATLEKDLAGERDISKHAFELNQPLHEQLSHMKKEMKVEHTWQQSLSMQIEQLERKENLKEMMNRMIGCDVNEMKKKVTELQAKLFATKNETEEGRTPTNTKNEQFRVNDSQLLNESMPSEKFDNAASVHGSLPSVSVCCKICETEIMTLDDFQKHAEEEHPYDANWMVDEYLRLQFD